MIDEDGHQGQDSDLDIISVTGARVGLQQRRVNYVGGGEPDERDDVCPEMD